MMFCSFSGNSLWCISRNCW